MLSARRRRTGMRRRKGKRETHSLERCRFTGLPGKVCLAVGTSRRETAVIGGNKTYRLGFDPNRRWQPLQFLHRPAPTEGSGAAEGRRWQKQASR